MRQIGITQSFKLFCITALMFVFSVIGHAQAMRPGSSAPPPPPPPQADGKADKTDSTHEFGGDPESEMKIRLALRAEQKEYDDNLARAREAAELGTQISEAFKGATLGTEETKKLERLEKLTRKIRNEAGGGSGMEEDARESPGTLEFAIQRVKELATTLQKSVEKTPKHVVSAAVIDNANNLLGLIQRVRRMAH
jgi:hypothetical protein